MDTLKREIYMEAMRLLAEEGSDYTLCTCLKVVTKRLTGFRPSMDEMPEFFPEFTVLADGKEWSPAGVVVNMNPPSTKNSTAYYWWQPHWPAPRIRLIQILLGDIR